MKHSVALQTDSNQVTDHSVFSPRSEKLSAVTKGEPCRHCGKPDWCYRIGELEVCKRGAEPASGWVKTSKADGEEHFYYAIETPKKSVRPKSKSEYVYRSRDGQPLIKIARSDDGEGNRSFYQKYWDGTNWADAKKLAPEVKEKIKKQVPIYRYQEVRHAIESGKTIFVVEGEGVAEVLWDLGIAATTFIGGSGKYRAYGSYQQDLEGAETIVLCPDRDEPGIAHMEDVNQDFKDAKWLYAPPGDFYWSHLPKSGGVDIKDWIQDGASVGQIFGAVEDKREVVRQLNETVTREEFQVKAEIQLLLKEEDPYKQIEIRKNLHKHGYSDKNIDYLLDSTDSATRRSKARSITATEFRNLEPEGAKFIFPGLLPQTGLTILGGEPGVGKTTLAYDAGACVLFGEPFLGETPSLTGKVLFVNSRGEMLLPQIQDSFINRGLFGSDNYELMLDWDIRQMSALENKVHEMQPTLVIVDSFAGIHIDASFDENSAQARRSIIQLQALSERYNTAIIVIHHSNKSGDTNGVGKLRGSSAIPAAASAIWLLSGEKDSPVKNFSVPKIRGACNTTMQLLLDAPEGRWKVHNAPADDSTSKSLGDKILAFMQSNPTGKFAIEELINEVSGNRDAMYKALQRLIQRGLVFKRPSNINYRRKVFGLVDKGQTPPSPYTQQVVSNENTESTTSKELDVIGHSLDTHWTNSGQSSNSHPVQQPCPMVETPSEQEVKVDSGQVDSKARGGSNNLCTESLNKQNNSEITTTCKESVNTSSTSQTQEAREESKPDTQSQIERFDASTNAALMLSCLEEENGAEMLRELFEDWTESQRRAVKEILFEQNKLTQIMELLRSAKAPESPTQANIATNEPSKTDSDKALEVSAPTNNEPQILKNCTIPLAVGMKVKCYPSHDHACNKWDVKAEVLSIKQERGYLLSCEIRYKKCKTKEATTAVICGGSAKDWLLEVCK